MTFLDTGPLVAMLNQRDQHHAWATKRSAEMGLQLWACGAVLSEACYLLDDQREPLARLHRLIGDGVIRCGGETSALWQRALALVEHYANVPMSFADACLVALAEETSDARIFTLDRDFLIYRQSDGRRLQLIAPFEE